MKWLTVILSFLILTSCQGRRQTKEEKAQAAKKLREDAYKVTNNDLPIPEILCPNKSPFEYITHEEIYKSTNQILLGIQIDNYSGYTLKNPDFVPYSGSSVTNVTNLGAVEKRRSELFILENPNNYVSGSLSWEVFHGENHMGKRLIVTFNVPWK